jgi:hypothetical protein
LRGDDRVRQRPVYDGTSQPNPDCRRVPCDSAEYDNDEGHRSYPQRCSEVELSDRIRVRKNPYGEATEEFEEQRRSGGERYSARRLLRTEAVVDCHERHRRASREQRQDRETFVLHAVRHRQSPPSATAEPVE